MSLRNFSSVAVATTLTAGITSGSTTIPVTALSGYPAAPFLARIDADTVDEELVLVTNVAGTSLTVTRGYDSSAAVAHLSGATFAHAASAIDFREANAHVNATSGIHGVTGVLVGTTDTQTLTNKTLTSPTISTILNSGTLTLPTSTDTLVGKATTDTLTNKTLTSPVINTATVSAPVLSLSTTTSTASARLAATPGSGQLNLGDGSAVLNFTADNKTATLTNKTLTSPSISGAALSGTLSGSPTFSGSPQFAGANFSSITVNGTDDLATGWTSYTPTLTGFTKGATGTVTGRYKRIGKLVHFEATFVMDATSAAATAAPTVTLPVAADSTAPNNGVTMASFTDQGTTTYRAIGQLASTTTCAAYIHGTNGAFVVPTATTPFTWSPVSGDQVAWSGVYMAA